MSGRIPRAVHNVGCLPIETAVTYPFHPFANQWSHEHAGTRHLIIRKPDGSAFLLPAAPKISVDSNDELIEK
jgi:hypothetical protein